MKRAPKYTEQKVRVFNNKTPLIAVFNRFPNWAFSMDPSENFFTDLAKDLIKYLNKMIRDASSILQL